MKLWTKTFWPFGETAMPCGARSVLKRLNLSLGERIDDRHVAAAFENRVEEGTERSKQRGYRRSCIVVIDAFCLILRFIR